MLTNTQKLAIYEGALERVRRSWVKKTFHDVYTGEVCLAGAIHQAAGDANVKLRWAYMDGWAASLEVQRELAEKIMQKSGWTQLKLGIHSTEATAQMDDGGLAGIEAWNDSKFRRKSQVVTLLQERIDFYRPLAQQETIDKLEAKVKKLKRKIADLNETVAELQERVAQLEQRNNIFTLARRKVSANELRDNSAELAKLDDELERAYADLNEASAR